MTDKSQLIREVFAELSKPGASVWITCTERRTYRIRASQAEGVFEALYSGDSWGVFTIGTSDWLSCEPCREPRVFEFEADSDTEPPADLAHAMCKGSRFRARFEEILEDQ